MKSSINRAGILQKWTMKQNTKEGFRQLSKLCLVAMMIVGCVTVCMGRYNSRAGKIKMIKLAKPRVKGQASFEEVLAKRRSVREFTSQSVDLIQIGQLAWAGQGITEPVRGFRTAPSAGAIYPMKLYFATQKGLFVYDPAEHSLEELSGVDIRNQLSVAALNQKPVAQASCDIIIAGSARKLAAKYRGKARRYMLLEAGHIAQNILLEVVSMELGAVPIGAFEIRKVSRVCQLPKDVEPLYIICVGYPAGKAEIKTGREKNNNFRAEGQMPKKAVLIIASRNFRDEELFETKVAIAQAGVETVVASTKTGFVTGMLGGKTEANILVSDIVVDDYDAIVFIGGSGAKEYFNDPVALNIARQAAAKGKVLAAICIAPSVLANAGVLEGVKATSFSSERVNLQQAGALFSGTAVEQDGLIITGSGPAASGLFAKTVANMLASRKR